MKLVTFDDGLVGELRHDRVAELDAPSMRAYFESGADARATGAEHALEVLAQRPDVEHRDLLAVEVPDAALSVPERDELHPATPQTLIAARAYTSAVLASPSISRFSPLTVSSSPVDVP